MNKNQRGEIWINARKERRQNAAGGQPATGEGADGHDEAAAEAPGAAPEALNPAATAEAPSPAADGAPSDAAPAASAQVAAAPAEPAASPVHTLAAVRLLLQPKKRGEGVAALVAEVASQLGQTPERLIEALSAVGVNEPADPEAKPTFGENAGEIFWLNRNARGELWLNAKPSKASAKKPRPKKKDDGTAAE
jgi:hypothetical protein